MEYLGVILMVVGAAAVLIVLLNLFFSYGDHTNYRWITEWVSVGSSDFLRAIARVTDGVVEHGGPVDVLNNGDGFLPRLLSDIAAAERSINFTAYIWEEGEMSDRIFTALSAALERGVEVRILVDAFGSFRAPKHQFRSLEAGGAYVERFRALRFGNFTRIHRRAHRRAIVIDGHIGYTGGMAVSDKWLGNAESGRKWRDMMFRVEGRMAQSLQNAFAQLWAGTSGEILSGAKFYPTLLPIRHENNPYVSLASSPVSETEPLPKFIWMTIACAEQSLTIVTPYFLPDRHIFRALMERARAGVKVRLMLPSARIDSAIVRAAMRHYYGVLFDAGVEIYEYRRAMLHSKYIVADGLWSVIGSPNMDRRSFELNKENVLGVQSGELASDLEDVFRNDLTDARHVTRQTWDKRGILSALFEWLCAFFVKQF